MYILSFAALGLIYSKHIISIDLELRSRQVEKVSSHSKIQFLRLESVCCQKKGNMLDYDLRVISLHLTN